MPGCTLLHFFLTDAGGDDQFLLGQIPRENIFPVPFRAKPGKTTGVPVPMTSCYMDMIIPA